MDLFGWEKAAADLLTARDTSLSVQFAQQCKLRMMAREAASKEVANSKLRRLLAYNKSFNCADVKIGDAVLLNKSTNKKSSPRRRGPAKILDIDETGGLRSLSHTHSKRRDIACGRKWRRKMWMIQNWIPRMRG